MTRVIDRNRTAFGPNAPPRNLAIPQTGNLTGAEILAFCPDWVRSADICFRLVTNGMTQKIAATMINHYRSIPNHALSCNTMGKMLQHTMRDGGHGKKWTVGNHEELVPDDWQNDSLSLAGCRLECEYFPRRSLIKGGVRSNYPFKYLMTDVKNVPGGGDALDLTRCVLYAANHPDEGWLFPKDFEELTNRLGGPHEVKADNLDGAVFARWGKVRGSEPKTLRARKARVKKQSKAGESDEDASHESTDEDAPHDETEVDLDQSMDTNPHSRNEDAHHGKASSTLGGPVRDMNALALGGPFHENTLEAYGIDDASHDLGMRTFSGEITLADFNMMGEQFQYPNVYHQIMQGFDPFNTQDGFSGQFDDAKFSGNMSRCQPELATGLDLDSPFGFATYHQYPCSQNGPNAAFRNGLDVGSAVNNNGFLHAAQHGLGKGRRYSEEQAALGLVELSQCHQANSVPTADALAPVAEQSYPMQFVNPANFMAPIGAGAQPKQFFPFGSMAAQPTLPQTPTVSRSGPSLSSPAPATPEYASSTSTVTSRPETPTPMEENDAYKYGGPRTQQPFRLLHELKYLRCDDVSDFAENIRFAKNVLFPDYQNGGTMVLYNESFAHEQMVTRDREEAEWESKEMKAFNARKAAQKARRERKRAAQANNAQ